MLLDVTRPVQAALGHPAAAQIVPTATTIFVEGFWQRLLFHRDVKFT